MREKLFKKKQVLTKSHDSVQNLNESSRSKKISKNDSNRFKSLDASKFRQSNDPAVQAEFNFSKLSSNQSNRKEMFGDMWRSYMNLLIMNNKFLFEDGHKKSKNFFCELLHSQIDVSNKLFMLVSRADDETFHSYMNFINDQSDLKEELGKSFIYSENLNEHPLDISDARQTYNKQITINTLQPYNYSSNLVSNTLEFPKPVNKEGHFADLKKFLFESGRDNEKEFSLGASLNFTETPNKLGNLSFLDVKSMKRNDLLDSNNNFTFSILNKSIPDNKANNFNQNDHRMNESHNLSKKEF